MGLLLLPTTMQTLDNFLYFNSKGVSFTNLSIANLYSVNTNQLDYSSELVYNESNKLERYSLGVGLKTELSELV